MSQGDNRSLTSQRTKMLFQSRTWIATSPNRNPCFLTKSQSWLHSFHAICKSIRPGLALPCAPRAGIHPSFTWGVQKCTNLPEIPIPKDLLPVFQPLLQDLQLQDALCWRWGGGNVLGVLSQGPGANLWNPGWDVCKCRRKSLSKVPNPEADFAPSPCPAHSRRAELQSKPKS